MIRFVLPVYLSWSIFFFFFCYGLHWKIFFFKKEGYLGGLQQHESACFVPLPPLKLDVPLKTCLFCPHCGLFGLFLCVQVCVRERHSRGAWPKSPDHQANTYHSCRLEVCFMLRDSAAASLVCRNQKVKRDTKCRIFLMLFPCWFFCYYDFLYVQDWAALMSIAAGNDKLVLCGSWAHPPSPLTPLFLSSVWWCCAHSALGRKHIAINLVRCKKHDLETLQKKI